MVIIEKLKKSLFKSKWRKLILIGGFSFFLIKGLLWLVVFFIAGFSLINFGS